MGTFNLSGMLIDGKLITMNIPTSKSTDDEVVDPMIVSAINCVKEKSNGTPLVSTLAITLNFHPDDGNGCVSMISQLVEDNIYRSQFETGTSNGSLSAQVGGRRWDWEKKMFGGTYDNASVSQRPKYGSLNYKNHPLGGAPRFGSAHLRLKSHVLVRSTFAYPDSHLDPVDFGTQDRMGLIELAEANTAGLEVLDDYIEAHVHGLVQMSKDVDAIVLDPSFQGTSIETSAQKLPVAIEWHDGVRLTSNHLENCLIYRGKEVADFIDELLSDKECITPASLSCYRDGSVDQQVLKKTWHCIVRFGGVKNSAY